MHAQKSAHHPRIPIKNPQRVVPPQNQKQTPKHHQPHLEEKLADQLHQRRHRDQRNQLDRRTLREKPLLQIQNGARPQGSQILSAALGNAQRQRDSGLQDLHLPLRVNELLVSEHSQLEEGELAHETA